MIHTAPQPNWLQAPEALGFVELPVEAAEARSGARGRRCRGCSRSAIRRTACEATQAIAPVVDAPDEAARFTLEQTIAQLPEWLRTERSPRAHT